MQTGTYEKDGVKMPFFEVVAEEQEFAESRGTGNNNDGNGKNNMDFDGFMDIPDDMEELPFD